MKPLTDIRWGRPCVLALVIALAAGCGGDDGAGPDEDVDLPEMATAVETTIAAYFTDNPALGSTNAVAAGIAGTLSGASRAIVPTGLTTDAHPAGVLGQLGPVMETLDRAGISGADPALANVIPAELLGVTLVYDPGTRLYEPDPSRSGAPSDGTRFILYEFDEVTGQPLTPLQEMGHLDLVDAGSGSTVMLGIEAVVNGATLIDLTLSVSGTETTLSFSVDGYISSDGSDRADITASADVTGTETETRVDASLEMSAPDVTITTEADGTTTLSGTTGTETGSGSVTSTVEYKGNTVRFNASTDESGNASGEVTRNGEVVAVISGDADTQDVVFSSPSGGELSQQDRQALERVFIAAGSAVAELAGLSVLGLLLAGGF